MEQNNLNVAYDQSAWEEWHKKSDAIIECGRFFAKSESKYQIDMSRKDMDGWLCETVNKHGIDNLEVAIAATILRRAGDGRIGRHAREWAENYNFTMPPSEILSRDNMLANYHILSVHSCAIDNAARKLMTFERDNVRIVSVAPLELPKIEFVPRKLELFQEIVGGDIETLHFDKDPTICIACNESGKFEGLPGNRTVGKDVIAGTFFITKVDKEGELVSLTDDEVERFSAQFSQIEHHEVKEVSVDTYMEVRIEDISGIVPEPEIDWGMEL